MQVDVDVYVAVLRTQYEAELAAMRDRLVAAFCERDMYAARLSKATETAAAEAEYDPQDQSENDE